MDIQKIIGEMTLEEKFRYLTGADSNAGYRLERFPIRQMRFHDGPFGLRMKGAEPGEKGTSAAFSSGTGQEVPSTAFPTGSAMCATWDPEIMEEMGQALGREFRAHGVNTLLGPAVNIKRHPLCGRNFEYLSEDPYLAGKMGSAYVKGVQSQGVAACPKHFAANNQEYGRFYLSSEVDERTLREIYLKPFEMIVKDAKPWSIMCSYNRLNGVFASEHKQLLQEILREEWGFDGIVVSDWGAVKNRAYSLLASVEMCMPYQEEAYNQLEEAYRKGLIDDRVVDAALERLFRFYDRTKGVYEPSAWDVEAHHRLAARISRESMVLLKNQNDLLPLDKSRIRRLLVVGQQAAEPYIGGDGSSRVTNPTRVETPLEEIRRALGPDVTVDFLGHDKLDAYCNQVGYMEAEVSKAAAGADAVIFFLSQDFASHSEAFDRSSMELPGNLVHAMRACWWTNQNIIAVLNVGDAIVTHKWEPFVGAILVSWLGGQAMGSAVAATLFGENNPSGKLPVTFPRALTDVKSLENYPGDGFRVEYREQLMVGYRHFDTNGVEPEYEFGFGLSYSRFRYENLTLEGDKLSFDLTNDSDRDGAEVAQVYVEFPKNSWVSHPARELKAFRRVFLRAHETKRVEIELPEASFHYYNVALKKWIPEEGEYTVRVGGSSRDLPLSATCKQTPGEPITNRFIP